MQTYMITINEMQRKIIELLLGYEPIDSFSIEEQEEIVLLRQNFLDLPEAEKSAPRALHGFCL